MSLYAIVLDAPSGGPWEAIPLHWPDHLIVDDRLAFVSAENAVTANIAEQAGIGPDGAAGIVIQMDFFSGHTRSSIAEWVSRRRD